LPPETRPCERPLPRGGCHRGCGIIVAPGARGSHRREGVPCPLWGRRLRPAVPSIAPLATCRPLL
jgi:hypothetical protein